MGSTKGTAFLFLVAASLLHVPAKCRSNDYEDKKMVVVTNNHTNFLSLRCYSFDDSLNLGHLAPGDQYKFLVHRSGVYPSSTMFNCSTNMGTFVAFKYNYECTKVKYDSCEWRFDEENAYRYDPKIQTWILYEYAPNYESLNRGGVVRGYFAN